MACLRVIARDPRRFPNSTDEPRTGSMTRGRSVKADQHQGGAGLWVASSVDV